MAKKNRRRKVKPGNKLNGHVAVGTIRDHQASAESCIIDAAADRRWFRENPTKKERQRPASSRERRALVLPVGTIVHVFRLPGGRQARVFAEPAPELN